METITEKDVKRVWLEKDAVCVELNDGRIGKEFFKDYAPLRNASDEDRADFRLDFDGVWFDRIGDGLELSGFFAPKKNNPIGRVFCEFPMLNASAVANDKMCGCNGNTLELTEKFRDFKQTGVQGIEACKIRSLILPLLADHVLREANHYIRILGE